MGVPMNQGSLILPGDRALPGFNGVVAGQTANCAIPIGPAYRRFWLAYGGMTLANMTNLRLAANGEIIRTYSGTDLDAINQYDKRTAAGGLLCLDFERRLLLTRQGREITALGTGGANPQPTDIKNLVLSVDIAAGAAGPVTLSGTAEIADPQSSGLILKNRVYTYNPTAAGEFEIADIPRLGIWQRLVFVTDNLTSLKLQLDGSVMFNRTATLNTRIQTDDQIRAPQAGYFVYDLTESGYGGNGMDPQSFTDIRWFLNLSAAGAVKVIVESLEDPVPYTA